MDELIGKKGRVIEEIDNKNERGKIMLNGMEWTARGEDDEKNIPLDAEVVVKKISGAHAVVSAK